MSNNHPHRKNIRRREFIALVGGAAAAWPLAARAQRARRVPHVVVYVGGSSGDSEVQKRAAAFREALGELGWIDGRNARVEVWWAADPLRVTPADATELIALNPDVIVTTGAPILAALHRQTKSIPIVFTLVTDPVSDGSSPAFHARAATSPGSPSSSTPSPENGWRC